MTHYIHALTPIEEACGVTLEDVAHELERGVFRDAGRMFIVDRNAGPALAASVARCAFAGQPVECIGLTMLGRAYRPA